MRTYFPTVTTIYYVRVKGEGRRTHAQSVILFEKNDGHVLCADDLASPRISDEDVSCRSCAGFVAQPNAVDVTDEIVAGCIA